MSFRVGPLLDRGIKYTISFFILTLTCLRHRFFDTQRKLAPAHLEDLGRPRKPRGGNDELAALRRGEGKGWSDDHAFPQGSRRVEPGVAPRWHHAPCTDQEPCPALGLRCAQAP